MTKKMPKVAVVRTRISKETRFRAKCECGWKDKKTYPERRNDLARQAAINHVCDVHGATRVTYL